MIRAFRVIALIAVAVLTLSAQGAATAQKSDTSTKNGATKKGAAPATSADAGTKVGILDINTATADELRQVPGIGEAYSAKIVAGRPYRAKNELVDKGIMPAGVYAKVKDHLVAKGGAATKSATAKGGKK